MHTESPRGDCPDAQAHSLQHKHMKLPRDTVDLEVSLLEPAHPGTVIILYSCFIWTQHRQQIDVYSSCLSG